MLYIAICDDDQYMSDKIKTMVSVFFQGKNTRIKTCQFASGEELLKYNNQIDILFLDIKMNGLSGMETAKILRRRNFKGFLVFTTVLSEMVFQSFEVQAYDYILKPIDEKHFKKTMERIFLSIQNKDMSKLLIKNGYESTIISFGDIVFCEVIGRKVYLHLISSEITSYYEKIGNLEKKLDGSFFKCHRSFLINLKYLKSYKDGTAYMEGGSRIPVSRLRAREFSDKILKYLEI